jgi:hypothetical protein
LWLHLKLQGCSSLQVVTITEITCLSLHSGRILGRIRILVEIQVLVLVAAAVVGAVVVRFGPHSNGS